MITTTITPAQLAGEIYDIIEELESLWEQGAWFSSSTKYLSETESLDIAFWLEELENPTCGTTACVAGWAAIKTAPPGTKVNNAFVIYPDGVKRTADNVGAEVLGLAYYDADWLFDSGRSRAEVLRALAAIRDGEEFSRYDYEDEDSRCDCGCEDDSYYDEDDDEDYDKDE